MSTTNEMYAALLRPAVIQILKATGFSFTKPSVVDALTDLAVRYLLLLVSSTAQTGPLYHFDNVPTLQDVRIALSENGVFRPQMSVSEESARGLVEVDGDIVPFEDLRGIKAFIAWAQGSVNKEIRRVAGFGDDIDVNEIAAGIDEKEDYVTAMRKKHSKTAEESRYQGTELGIQLDVTPVAIAGSDMLSIADWIEQQARAAANTRSQTATGSQSPATSVLSSAPSTPQDIMDDLVRTPVEGATVG